MSATTTARPPLTASTLLAQLAELVDRHDPADDVAELLDEVAGVVRRARAAVRRARPKPEPEAATPAAAKPEQQPAVTAVPAATAAAAKPPGSGVPVTGTASAPAAWTRHRWAALAGLLVLLVAVLCAVLVHPAALALALAAPAAMYAVARTPWRRTTSGHPA